MARTTGRWQVVLALSAATGAWSGMTWPTSVVVPLALALALGIAALGRLGPVLLCLATALAAATLAQRSMAGLDVPPESGSVRDEVTLVSDPVPSAGGAVRADVRLDGRRLALVAYRSAAAALDDRLAGEQVMVLGRVLPPGSYEERMRHRHLAGRLYVDTVTGWRPGHGVTRLANGVRRTLTEGAASLPPGQRHLLTGLVLGDDRHLPAELAEDFRAAGLTHLTAVSGQNLSLVLTALAPLLLRLRFAPRLALTLLVLAGLALLTRGEPSVLRATTMAVVSAWGAAVGRPSTSLRRLTLAVTGLLLVDPLLVSSLGFQLSVAGSAGIIVGAEPLQRRLPGPRWLALPVAVTCAAQAAVAPLLVWAFGEVRLATLPANLLAGPAAGPVMVWGLSGGLVAGLVGEPLAWLLHLPTRLLVGWLEAVAAAAAGWPLGALSAGHLLALGGTVAVGVGSRRITAERRRFRRMARLAQALAATVAAIVVGVGVLPGSSPPVADGKTVLGPGTTLWRGGGGVVVLLDGRAISAGVEAGLVRHGTDHVDVVVVRSGTAQALAAAARLRERSPSALVLVPARAAGPIPGGAETPIPGTIVEVGSLRLRLGANGPRLDAEVVQQ
jgi:competence protein ComEC